MAAAEYRDDQEALVGLARQLADAYEEARDDDDRAYAADAIDDFLSECDEFAPEEALIALLDLPLDKLTWPLVDSVEATLVARGASVVRPLLEAAAGRVYDHDGTTEARALETLRALRPADAVPVLVDVLCRPGRDELKETAVQALAGAGGGARPAVEAALSGSAEPQWLEAALAAIAAAEEEEETG